MDGGDPVIGYRGTPYPRWKKRGVIRHGDAGKFLF